MAVFEALESFVRSRKFLLSAVAIAIAALIPLLNVTEVLIYGPLIMIFAVYASSWNLLAYSGQGSLGHAVFLGVGGFASALVAIKLGISPIFSLFFGALLSAGLGFLIGLTCVRLKAWFLAMVTFGFSVIAVSLFSQFDSFMHGITGFPTRKLIAAGMPFYYLMLGFLVVSVLAIYLIMKSRVGLAFKAIRENEMEAKMVGINAAKYKLIAFVISTFIAGLAGGLYVHNPQLGYVDNSIFSPTNSFSPLIMSVIGGLGTLEGPIIGAFILISVQTWLSLPVVSNSLQHSLGFLFPNVSRVGPPLTFLGIGVLLVVIVIFAPKGVSSLLRRVYGYFVGKIRKS